MRCGLTSSSRHVLRNLLLASLSLCALPAWLPAHAASGWWETRHGDFHIVSQLSRAETAQIARDIQIHQRALGAFFSNADIRPHVPVTILLLDKILWKQILAEPGKVGIVFPSDDHFHVVVNGDVWLQASNIVYHELTHIVLHKIAGGSAVPLWLDEGYADLLSTVETGKDSVKVGMYPAWRLYSLQEKPWMPLQTLLAVSRTSAEYKSEKLAGAFYAQAWLMTHFYIFGNPERRAQIRKYLALVGENEPPQSAFAKAFAGDRGEFEKELQQYSRQRRLNYMQIPVADMGNNIESVVTEMPAAAASEELAAWMLRYGRLDDSDMKFLEQQAKDTPPTSIANLQLTVAYLMKNKMNPGKARLEAGCAAPASTARGAILCGDAYALLTDASESAAAGSDEGMLLARQFFVAALQIEPRNVEALTRAAETYRSVGGDAEALVASLEQSLARDPNNPSLAIGLATVLQYSDAAKTKDYLERALINVSDPDRVQHLVEWLEFVEQQIAARAPEAG